MVILKSKKQTANNTGGITSFVLKSVSSKEEALLALSRSNEWNSAVANVVEDVRHWWMAEPMAIDSRFINYVLIRAYIRSGLVSVKIPINMINGHRDSAINFIIRHYFLQRHISNSDLWNSLILCARYFPDWGLDSVNILMQHKQHSNLKRRRLDVFDFSDFWMPAFVGEIIRLTGQTMFAMANHVFEEAEFSLKSPIKQAMYLSQDIIRLKKDAHMLSANFYAHGVDVNEVTDIIKSYYVKKVMNQ